MAHDHTTSGSSGTCPAKSNDTTSRRPVCLAMCSGLFGPAVLLIAAACATLLASCATLQVPAARPVFPTRETLRESRDGIDVGVRPVVSEDDYLRVFDDFLPEIGVAALWVEVKNSRSTPIEIQRSNWRLHTGSRIYRAMSVHEVFDRYYRGRRIRVYTTGADRDAQRKMERLSFENGRIEPSTEHAGLIFFAVDPASARRWDRGATLSLTDVRPVRGAKIAIQIRLSHANS